MRIAPHYDHKYRLIVPGMGMLGSMGMAQLVGSGLAGGTKAIEKRVRPEIYGQYDPRQLGTQGARGRVRPEFQYRSSDLQGFGSLEPSPYAPR